MAAELLKDSFASSGLAPATLQFNTCGRRAGTSPKEARLIFERHEYLRGYKDHDSISRLPVLPHLPYHQSAASTTTWPNQKSFN